MQDMSPQDAHRIGPQEALQSYLDDLLHEAPGDRPVQAEAAARPKPASVATPAPTPEAAPAPAAAARPTVHEPRVIEPRPLVLPTIKLTDVKLVETPVDEAAAPIRTALAEPTPPAPVVEVVNEPQPQPLSVSVAVSVSLSGAETEEAAPVAERAPFPETVTPVAPLPVAAEPVVAPPAPRVAPLSEPLPAASAPPVVERPVAAEAPAPSAPLRETAEPAPVPPVLMPSLLTTAAPLQAPPQVETPVETPVVEPTPPAAAPPLPPKVVSGRPQWGEESFECLLFDVAGLTLAVPLVCLGTIHSLEGQTLTPLFGQPDWFLGMLKAHTGNIKVIDTARWVMPERYRDDFRDDLAFVITIQGFDWGLAVHKVDRSIHLHPDQVKWRSLRTQRPWLAGTVIEHMCALLDVAALAELIESGALKHTRR